MNAPPKLPKLPALPPRPTDGLAAAMHDIADALQYPVDSKGRVYDLRFLIPVVSFHLARVGCVIDPDRAVIKPRRLPPTAGVVEDAVEWVPLNAPESVDDELAGKTIADIDRLSPTARAELIRRLGGKTAAPEPQPTEWHVEPTIRFDDDQENH